MRTNMKTDTMDSNPLVKVITVRTCYGLLVTIPSRLGNIHKGDFSNFFIMMI